MTRKFALILLAAALPFGSCKKLPFFKKDPPIAAAPASGSPAAVAAVPGGTGAPPPQPPKQAAEQTSSPQVEINTRASAIVLCYHNIEDGSKMKALTITVAEFEKEMQAVKDNGFTVIKMQDLLAWRRGEKDIPAKSAVITIDDGWLSGYENAWPILKKYGYPFTMYIYVNYVGSGGKSLSWDQLAEMRDGGVDIGCHTWSHSNLRIPGGGVDAKNHAMIMKDVAALGADGWMRKEIIESKKTLEKQLGIQCNTFAYPFGNWNTKARELVKEAGYEAAFTVYGQQIRHSSPPFDLMGRYAVEAAKPVIFTDAMKMAGGGVAGGPAPVSNVGQVAASSMVTQPMEGETITNPMPLIKANLATMGEIEPGSVEIRLSGLGALQAKYDAATKTVEAQVTQRLREPEYRAFITAKVKGKKVETSWNFKYDASGAPGSAATEIPSPPPGSAPSASTAAPPEPVSIKAPPATKPKKKK